MADTVILINEEIELTRYGNGVGWTIKGARSFSRLRELHQQCKDLFGDEGGFMQRKKQDDEELSPVERDKRRRQAVAIAMKKRRG